MNHSRLSSIKRKADDLAKLSMNQHLRLAVTGLSGAGKTAFITSLVNQLLMGAENHQLPLWQLAREHRFLGAKRIPQPHLHLASFDYQGGIDALQSQPPCWPSPTHGVSEIRLKLRYTPQSLFWRKLNHSATLNLDIVDYPGEWLLDLPLLNMNYAQWCEHIALSLKDSRKAQLAEHWQSLAQQLDIQQSANELQIADIAKAYTEYLHQCKRELGMHHIQPGRFVLPGELAGAPVLAFFPISPALAAAKTNNKDSTLTLLNQRFEYYKEHVVKQFYQQHFVKFDRQIVLVDCLTPLNSGHDSFSDMQLAVNQILHSFNYGQSGILRRLFSPNIDKLLFAATKADHVTPEQHSHLVSLLSEVVAEGKRHVKFEGINTSTVALASIKATQTGKAQLNGESINALKGILQSDANNQQPTTLFPGEVPSSLPKQNFWQQQGFEFSPFQPPQANPYSALPHIRIDQAIEFLLGDKFK
ncbi:YcjX family protein [Agarivorans sp. TSD2052]|uniref:YcjX family protein n=1 Tax=Agarivorans sp. TSD2052 TaxID=2937286 RepID=UPI00200DD20D|nr:YcjX family protein [Agarivorans sp. TSD2052]UPW17233.1 YcjX family protein [Agarivorans sp. TSD2052]